MVHYRGLSCYGALHVGGYPVMVHYRGLSCYGALQGVILLWCTTGGYPVMEVPDFVIFYLCD